MIKYLLGVDGGNTKTDYYLFTTDIKFVDMYRGGTCSHEGLKDGFQGTKRVISSVMDEFLKRNNITISDIDAACFGLAGCDIPSQHKELVRVIGEIGFKKFIVVNDSLLGIKAGTTKGYGVCSINGTGTSASGIDLNGDILQVGGIGDVCGDRAGGRYIARQVVAKAFDSVMRFGKPTSLTKIVMDRLNVTDNKLFMQSIGENFYRRDFDYNYFTVSCFKEANKGDSVAIEILTTIANDLAKSVSSVIVNLDFKDDVEVVMAGSVYLKGECPILNDTFKELTIKYSNKKCLFNLLSVPPATGAIIWAKELHDGAFPSYELRMHIIDIVSKVLERM